MQASDTPVCMGHLRPGSRFRGSPHLRGCLQRVRAARDRGRSSGRGLKLSRGTRDGAPFIYVGILLSVLFGLVALCSLGAGALEATFFAEEGEEAWSIMDAITPLLYLAVIGAAGFLAWGREFLRGFFPA